MSQAVLEAEKTGSEAGLMFEDRPERDPAHFPSWFRDARDRAWKEFRELPMPRRTQEPWRFADLKKLDVENCRYAAGIDESLAARLVAESARLEDVAGRLVFANDRVISSTACVDEGVVFLSFEEALERYPEQVEKYFMLRKAGLGSEKFQALHKAVMRNGTFVHLSKGVQLQRPLEVYHWLHGAEVAVFPHTLVFAEAGSKATVINYHRCTGSGDSGLSVSVADLIVGEGADVTMLSCQDRNHASRMIQMNAASVYRNGNARSFLFNMGAGWVRNEIVSYLLEEGANSEMYSVSVTNDGQEIDQRTLQHHEAPRTTSDLLFKNALFDTSRTIFAGLIKVDEDAHGTDAYQKCRNLLSSDDAEANSMPGLEINADHVKCSHGATAGQVSDDELFYLESRGIHPAFARKLITFGFTREVVERIGDDQIEAMVTALIEKKFESLKF